MEKITKFFFEDLLIKYPKLVELGFVLKHPIIFPNTSWTGAVLLNKQIPSTYRDLHYQMILARHKHKMHYIGLWIEPWCQKQYNMAYKIPWEDSHILIDKSVPKNLRCNFKATRPPSIDKLRFRVDNIITLKLLRQVLYNIAYAMCKGGENAIGSTKYYV